MSKVNETVHPSPPAQASPALPLPVLVVFRGIGQIFFQENALSGALFALGIALSMPVQALGLVVGAAIGTAVAWAMKFDRDELAAGIYGFNSALVGTATLFFFQPGAVSLVLLAVGCAVAALLTRAMRRYVPFPTYTTPFIVTTWGLYLLALSLKVAPTDSAAAPLVPNPAVSFAVEASAHGIGQVMFQASLWTGLLFFAGIALSDREHAAWVLAGSVAGMLVASYHVAAGMNAIDPERLIPRTQFENVALGLYGYNATLAPVALYLWRRSLIPPLLGILLTVPLTELVPLLGIPALTAPFVLATWIVLGLGWLDRKFLAKPPAPVS